MTNDGFIIAEFDDGLQLIPAKWYNGDKQVCIWPSHFKTKLRINKAIMTKEIPQEVCDWEELPIKRIFGIASKLNVLSNQTGCSILTYTQNISNTIYFRKKCFKSKL